MSKISFDEFVLDINNEKEQLDWKVDAELRRRGWGRSSHHPGALSLWSKNGYTVDRTSAIHIECWWDAYGDEKGEP